MAPKTNLFLYYLTVQPPRSVPEESVIRRRKLVPRRKRRLTVCVTQAPHAPPPHLTLPPAAPLMAPIPRMVPMAPVPPMEAVWRPPAPRMAPPVDIAALIQVLSQAALCRAMASADMHNMTTSTPWRTITSEYDPGDILILSLTLGPCLTLIAARLITS